MSDETVAQARRARIEALNELISELGKIDLHISSFMDKRMDELDRLLDQEKAPDDEEEVMADKDAEIKRLRAEVVLQGNRIIELEAEIDKLRQVSDQRLTQIALQEDSIESLQASVARQSETIREQQIAFLECKERCRFYKEGYDQKTRHLDSRNDRIRELEEAIEQIHRIVS